MIDDQMARLIDECCERWAEALERLARYDAGDEPCLCETEFTCLARHEDDA